jgi:hypothetical protein
MKPKTKFDENGNRLEGVVQIVNTKMWYENGLLHRDKGPAKIEYDENGKVKALFWYTKGFINRFKKPAVIYKNGYRAWYKQGKKVKLENNGYLEFYNLLGHLHRLDGPAIIKENGDKEWYQYGKLHRENGPAVELSNGTKAWYEYGVQKSISYDNVREITFKKEEEEKDFTVIYRQIEDDLDKLIVKYSSNNETVFLGEYLKNTLKNLKLLLNSKIFKSDKNNQSMLINKNIEVTSSGKPEFASFVRKIVERDKKQEQCK